MDVRDFSSKRALAQRTLLRPRPALPPAYLLRAAPEPAWPAALVVRGGRRRSVGAGRLPRLPCLPRRPTGRQLDVKSTVTRATPTPGPGCRAHRGSPRKSKFGPARASRSSGRGGPAPAVRARSEHCSACLAPPRPAAAPPPPGLPRTPPRRHRRRVQGAPRPYAHRVMQVLLHYFRERTSTAAATRDQ